MDGFNFKLGMEFGSVQLLKNTLKEHFILESKEYKLLANDLEKFRAVCRAPGCPYLLYAHVNGDGKTFRINKMKPKHQCGIVMHPNMDFSAFHQMTQNIKFSKVSNHQFYRARDTARIILEGSVKDQYEIVEKKKGERPPVKNPTKETIKRKKRKERQKAGESAVGAGTSTATS
ncbi:hypothetical protein F8388_000716 [Cannabis sativa]|uniref:Transposase MuDR plant domain-containing protein n=1 Tax=Cannabis sativa TaxID=3483 RepID=A0A7J6EF22_CANSA|nr:hypothetical protein F8388_000716 [Cannabis sativa]KAF4378465.1 hypothetical protein G4B88_027525 [Cannabis sativa]